MRITKKTENRVIITGSCYPSNFHSRISHFPVQGMMVPNFPFCPIICRIARIIFLAAATNFFLCFLVERTTIVTNMHAIASATLNARKSCVNPASGLRGIHATFR